MSRFAAVTLTWILSQLLHPLAWIWVWKEAWFDAWLGIMAISFIFSLPSYLLCLLAYPLIENWKAGAVARTIGWLVLSQVCIVAGSFLSFLFIGYGIFFLELTYPAHLAAAIAVVVLAPFLFRKRKAVAIPEDFLVGTINPIQSDQ